MTQASASSSEKGKLRKRFHSIIDPLNVAGDEKRRYQG